MEQRRTFKIVKVRNGTLCREEDTVATEYSLTVFLNQKEYATLMCTPKSLKDLAVGFLFSEGIIGSREDLLDVTTDEESGQVYVYTKNEDTYFFEGSKVCGKRVVTTACGSQKTILYNVIDFLGTDRDKIRLPIMLEPKDVLKLMNVFNKKSELFISTGGVHSCALCSNDQIMIFEEDVGRHNALDKILGNALINGMDLSDKIIATSGRISSEMVVKVVKSRIPALISRSAPTDSAVELARKLNLTLVGFARGEKMNVYSGFKSFEV